MTEDIQESRGRVRDDISVQRDGDTGILLDLRTNDYFELNATGLQIWELLAEGQSNDTIANELSERFAVSPGEARRAVDGWLEELRAAGLLAGTGPSNEGPLRRLLRRIAPRR